MALTYESAGVNIAAGNEAINKVKTALKSTFNSAVLTDIGAFGAMYDLNALMQNYRHPVLVQSVDGVGTKMMIAKMMHDYRTIGIDLVSATVNDIVVLGATPLTLLDYIAADRLEPLIIETIILGMVQACKEHDIALIGGELAEMPGTYLTHEHDLVGFVTGVVEKDRAIMGKNIVAGDVVFALPSSGLHTNGYSLARKILFDKCGFSIDHYLNALQMPVGEALLKPHINYAKPILNALNHEVPIKGMAHITGGGLLENLPRILPGELDIEIKREACPILPIFQALQELGQVPETEMYRTFNMGMGFIIIIDSKDEAKLRSSITEASKLPLYKIGHVMPGKKQVRLV